MDYFTFSFWLGSLYVSEVEQEEGDTIITAVAIVSMFLNIKEVCVTNA